MSPTVSVATFPARSYACAVRDCPEPSVVTTVCCGLHDAMPDTASAHANVTDTSVLFQPYAFAGVLTAVSTGGVRSMLYAGVETTARLPATSMTVIVPRTPAPSAVMVNGLALEPGAT